MACRRRQRDCEYKIADSEHIRELPECSLERLGLALSADASSCSAPTSWRLAACKLGLDNGDVQAVEAVAILGAPGTCNPGYEVLKKWRQRARSTVAVLRQVLANIGRDDVVQQLDQLLYDWIDLTIWLYDEDLLIHDFSGPCPARKPLIEYVRPQVIRKLSADLLANPIIIRMRRPRSDVDTQWTWRAKLFQGQHVILDKFVTPPRERSERQRRCCPKVGVERRVVSESKEIIWFDIGQESSEGSGESSPRHSLPADDETGLQPRVVKAEMETGKSGGGVETQPLGGVN